MLVVIAIPSIMAKPITHDTITINQLHTTTFLSDEEMLNVVGGDWVDAACAFISGAEAGLVARGAYVLATRAAASAHPVTAIVLGAATVYCYFR